VKPKALFLICGAVLLFSPLIDASPRLTLRVFPRMAHAPADLLILVSVERRPENRHLIVSAESPDFFRSSEIDLDGEDSARVTSISFRSLPPGAYSIHASLIGANGRTIEVTESSVWVV
jgi:hypothetical protein